MIDEVTHEETEKLEKNLRKGKKKEWIEKKRKIKKQGRESGISQELYNNTFLGRQRAGNIDPERQWEMVELWQHF